MFWSLHYVCLFVTFSLATLGNIVCLVNQFILVLFLFNLFVFLKYSFLLLYISLTPWETNCYTYFDRLVYWSFINNINDRQWYIIALFNRFGFFIFYFVIRHQTTFLLYMYRCRRSTLQWRSITVNNLILKW